MTPEMQPWSIVISIVDLDEEGNCPLCQVDYAECPCPGPTQEEYEYDELDGIMIARRVKENPFMITFEIPGKPFAKQRARATRQGRVYTPKETVSFERQVAAIAAEYFGEPFTGPVKLTVLATFEPAKSWSKKKTQDHLGTPHTQRPDLDNIAKAIKDALNRIAWVDDSQVAEMVTRKTWGPYPKTVVAVEPLTWTDWMRL